METKEIDLEAVRKEIEEKGLKKFIREELKKRCITSVKLAKELGVSKQTVLDTMNCKKGKTSRNVFKVIDEKLGLPEGFLHSEYKRINMLWIKPEKKERLLKALKRQKRREKMLQKKLQQQQQGGNHENS